MTSKTIVIKWTNPTQFHTGLTGSKEEAMPLNNTSPIVTAPDSTTGGQIWFPIVNRIMIQIKNLDDNSYETWGTRKSQNLAQTDTDGSYPFPNARVICEKAKVIPPAPTNNGNITSNITYTDADGTSAREKVHKLSEFANSIILYKDANVPTNLEENNGNKIALKDKRVYNPPGDSAENLTFSIPDSILGYEIKIWLENQYYTGTASLPSLTEDDLNVVTLNKITRKMDENGVEIDTYVPNSELITFQKVKPPTELYVADYNTTNGFHVEVGRIEDSTIHYLECIIPQHTKISNGSDYSASTPLTSETNGQEDDVFFKGYFIEYQTIPADVTYSSNTENDIASAFVSGTSGFEDWEYVKFHTIKNDSNTTNVFTFNSSKGPTGITLATDTEAKVLYGNVGTDIDWTGAINPQTGAAADNNYGDGFISAGKVTSGAFDTKTADIDYSVSKAFLLPQGVNKFYRFRIRGLNTGNKKPGPPSTKYAYFIFNKPAQIYWDLAADRLPKFIPVYNGNGDNKWKIELNWKDTDNNATTPGPYYSSMAVTGGAKAYETDKIAIMEYKLERRDTTDDTNWRTISYWANTNRKNPSTTDGLNEYHNYQIWPTPSRKKDKNYGDYEVTNNVVEKISSGWVGEDDTGYAEWNQAKAEISSAYTVEARLMAAGRNPSFQFRIQARNYLYGERKKASSSENEEKHWLQENTITKDSRWSDHSSASTALVTTSHTSLETGENYKVVLHDVDGEASTSFQKNKYQIKFYEMMSVEGYSPWNFDTQDPGYHTDYSDYIGRYVNYTNEASRELPTPLYNQEGNGIPENDYISYQWKLSETVGNKLKTTKDAVTGLTIDRYDIEEVIVGSDNLASNVETIYSSNFEYGPANWHIREYSQSNQVEVPSFKFRVKSYNFFNSTGSIWSNYSTELKPTAPSPPQFLSNGAPAVSGKENSNPTFSLEDDGITILVDEPQYTGYNTNSPDTQYNDNYYEDQAISIKEFKLEKVLLDSATESPTGEISLINSDDKTLRDGDGISTDYGRSQVATFFHPNGYTNNTALKDLNTGIVEYSFYAKNVLNTSFSAPSSCTLTIEKPNPGSNFKYCPIFTWVSSTNKVKLEFFRKAGTPSTSTEILKDDPLKDDPNKDTTDDSTVAPISDVTANCKFSNTVKKLAWDVQCNDVNWTVTTSAIPNSFPTTNTSFTITGDDDDATSAHTISDIHIEDQTPEISYTIDYRIRNQYNANYFASNVVSDIGSDVSPLQIKLNVPAWTTTDDNNVFTSQFTYGLPSASATAGKNKIIISWKRPTHGGLYFKHQGGGSISQVPSPNIKKYKIYLKATNHTAATATHTYYICTITQNWVSGDYKNARHSSTPTLTIYSGGTTLPASATGNNTQNIVIKKITGGSAADYYVGTEATTITPTNFRFKPEHEYTVEKITAFNWLYPDGESENMNNNITTKYQNGIDGGTTATITSLTPVQINALGTVNYPPIGSNKYIAQSVVTGVAADDDGAGTAPAVAGPQLNTFSQYTNKGSLISGEGISSTTNVSVNKLEEIGGTTVSDIIINKDYAKITNSTVGMSIRLGVKISSGPETFTNFCTFTKSNCAGKDLKYKWGTGDASTTGTTIATIISETNPADIYDGNDEWKTDNQEYWFTSASIKISTVSTINAVTDFWGKSVVFTVYVYYHSQNNVFNTTLTSSTWSNDAKWTLANTPNSNYYDNGSLGFPTAIATAAGTITYTGNQVYTVLGLPILKTGKMPSIQYKFDNKSTKWALHTDNNVLDVKLGSSATSVISTTTTDNSDHKWSDTTSVSLASNLNIQFPDTTSKTSLVKNAQLYVKATNIVGTQASWYNGWSGDATKFIYDPNTLALINTINSQNLTSNTISSSGTIFNSSSVSFDSKPLFNVLKTPNNFNPLTDHGTGNNWFGATTKFSILDVTNSDVIISGDTDNNISQTPIYDGKFVSETYFRNKFGTSSTNYHSNVDTFISNMDGSTPTSTTVYADSNNAVQDNLKTNYRWGIFSMSYENTGKATAAVNYAEFSLGSNSICNFKSSDLYSVGVKTVAKIEIWYKCINNVTETRWNKLTENNSADKDNATNDINQNYNTGSTAAALPSSGWILNAANTSVSKAIKSSNESTWASTKRIQFLIKQQVKPDKRLDILIAIGIKNNLDRFYGIPRAYSSSYIYRASGSSPYNAVTIG